MSTKVLFLLKRREDYNSTHHSAIGVSTGLYNSARFMRDMLVDLGISSEIEVVIDNNDIDRAVTKYRPKFVIIEALWVVPQKFQILKKLHPEVTWIIRLHSEMPFMAMEGIAMDWIGEYAAIDKMLIACNAPRMMRDIATFINPKKLIYLPNYYPQNYVQKSLNKDKEYIDISCFGAVRPLKNHLVQAIAALHFAKSKGKKLRFHINSGRIEQRGDSVLNNLIGLFQHLYDDGHELINHKWAPREEFLKVCAQMDIGLQCNFSETFNIVSADLLSQGVPIVGSSEIPWSFSMFNAIPTDIESISNKLALTYTMPKLNVSVNQRNLKKYTNKTKKIWYKFFGENKHGK